MGYPLVVNCGEAMVPIRVCEDDHDPGYTFHCPPGVADDCVRTILETVVNELDFMDFDALKQVSLDCLEMMAIVMQAVRGDCPPRLCEAIVYKRNYVEVK